MSKYLKDRLKSVDSYVPGEQLNDKEYIKLNTNESPYPPGPLVLDAVQKEDLEKLRLYPSPTQNELKTKLAESLAKKPNNNIELKSENIFLSNGSDDILNFAFMAFSGDGRAAVYPEISYGFYKVFCEFQGIDKIEIPLRNDFSISLSDYNIERYKEYSDGLSNDNNSERELKIGLVVIANPNAPTGLALSTSEIEEIVKNNSESVVLIDEAYIDFGGETAVPLIGKYDNLLISRTYSKSASLAGARLGYAIGNPEIIRDLEFIKYSTNPYNINRMTELTGLAVLKENEYYSNNIEKIKTTRAYVRNKLLDMGFYVTDSKANFLFVGKASRTIGGEELYLRLKEEGILVRWFSNERIKDFIRVTIGSAEEMDKFLDALQKIEGARN